MTGGRAASRLAMLWIWRLSVLIGLALLAANIESDHARAQGGNDGTDLVSQIRRLYSERKFPEALSLAKRYQQFARQRYGEDHVEFGVAITWIARIYRAQGRYSEAEPLFQHALFTFEKVIGSDHTDIGVMLNDLSGLYLALGRYGEAEPLMKRALAIAEKKEGVDHPDVAVALNNLARIYIRQGRYAEAEPLYKRAISIFEKAAGADDSDFAAMLSNLGEIYLAQGRYSDAELLFMRALAIRKKTLAPDHPEISALLNSLGVLHYHQKRYADAEPLLKRSLALTEKALSADHPSFGSSLANLATLYEAQGRHTETEALYERSLAIREKALGPDHPSVGKTLNNLAMLRGRQGRYADAEQLYVRSLAIQERASGSDHPDFAIILNNLAGLAAARGDWAQAAEYWRRSTKVIERRLERGLAGSEGTSARGEVVQNIAYFFRLIKMADRLAPVGHANRAMQAREMFATAQWAQGTEVASALIQMAVRTANGNPVLAAIIRERQDLVEEWQAKDKLLIVSKSEEAAKRKVAAEKTLADRLAAIDTRFAEIDRQLAKDFPDYAALASPAPVSVADVQAQLGADEAVVLFLDTPEIKPVPEETFVWIVTKSDVRWVRSDLGTTALAREVAALRCGLDATAWHGEGAQKCAKAMGIDLSGADQPLPFDHARAHKLYSALFGEVQDLVKGKHLLIVPSGPLTQLPFQVLVTKPPTSEDHRTIAWLARDHAITILPAVSSLKALRRTGKPSAASKPMIGFGNPLLDGPDARYANRAKLAREHQRCSDGRSQRVTAIVGHRGSVSRVETRSALADVSHIKMQVPLPETAEELCAVAQDVKADGRDIHLGTQATEREIKRLSANGELAKYRLLHFATHGVLAGQLDGTHEPGLILTPPDKATEEDDGYLSASEITNLKLDADWVILSACNTAAGGATSAEALSGLARAFIYAQARAMLVSHWAVDSDATVNFIKTAVREMAGDAKVGRAEALRRSMLALIDKGEPHEAHPAYWAPFVVVGEGNTDAAVTTGATMVTNMKKTPTAAKNQKPAPRPQDWRVEILR